MIASAPAAIAGSGRQGLNYLLPQMFDQGKTAQQADLLSKFRRRAAAR